MATGPLLAGGGDPRHPRLPADTGLDSPGGATALTTTRPDDTSLSRFSVLDWIGVLVVSASGLLSLAMPLLVGPVFRRLSDSLGVAPPAAGVLLQGWIPLAVGLSPLALLAFALAVRQPLGRRRLVLVLAFALTVLAGAVFLFALYGTLFGIAGAPTGP